MAAPVITMATSLDQPHTVVGLNPDTLRGVHHIALNVKDKTASRQYYGGILGLHELTGDEIPVTLLNLTPTLLSFFRGPFMWPLILRRRYSTWLLPSSRCIRSPSIMAPSADPLGGASIFTIPMGFSWRFAAILRQT